MGTVHTGAEFAKKMTAAGQAVKRSVPIGLAGSSLAIKRSVAQAAGKYAGSPLTRVSYKVTEGEKPQSIVRMTNRKAHLLERDTKPHDIVPRKLSTRSKKLRVGRAVAALFGQSSSYTGARALRIPGIGFRASAHSRGTRGKHIWERGVAAALPTIGKEFDKGLVIELEKALR